MSTAVIVALSGLLSIGADEPNPPRPAMLGVTVVAVALDGTDVRKTAPSSVQELRQTLVTPAMSDAQHCVGAPGKYVQWRVEATPVKAYGRYTQFHLRWQRQPGTGIPLLDARPHETLITLAPGRSVRLDTVPGSECGILHFALMVGIAPDREPVIYAIDATLSTAVDARTNHVIETQQARVRMGGEVEILFAGLIPSSRTGVQSEVSVTVRLEDVNGKGPTGIVDIRRARYENGRVRRDASARHEMHLNGLATGGTVMRVLSALGDGPELVVRLSARRIR